MPVVHSFESQNHSQQHTMLINKTLSNILNDDCFCFFCGRELRMVINHLNGILNYAEHGFIKLIDRMLYKRHLYVTFYEGSNCLLKKRVRGRYLFKLVEYVVLCVYV